MSSENILTGDEKVMRAGSAGAPARVRRHRSRLAYDLATIRVLAGRDVTRFFRQKSRIVGALAQPLLFWLLIGSGFEQSFKIVGAENVGYREYFFPGIVVLVVLFTSIFTTMSVIEDRHEGFLQAVLVAPASRAAVVLGKTLGGVSIALIQAAMVLALSPLAGFSLVAVDWPLCLSMLFLTAVGLSALGFALAWWIDSTQGYHAIMFVLLLPLWILSGAMFPASGAMPWLGAAMPWNPMAYCVAGVRRALMGGAGHSTGLAMSGPLGVAGSSVVRELAVVLVFAVVMTALAAWVIGRPGRAK